MSQIRADDPTYLRKCKLRKFLRDYPRGYLTAVCWDYNRIRKSCQWYSEHYRCALTPGDIDDGDDASDPSSLVLVGLIALTGLSTGSLCFCTTILHMTTHDRQVQFLYVLPTFTCLHNYWQNQHNLATFCRHVLLNMIQYLNLT